MDIYKGYNGSSIIINNKQKSIRLVLNIDDIIYTNNINNNIESDNNNYIKYKLDEMDDINDDLICIYPCNYLTNV
uniref:Uncharacterized protein n=1 Tax=Pithovirus LCPAC102 TaxID=2506587 RepID=A0A481Z595_9VIRU|nr:MAG: hypothetical protein LCPAC102_00920 [Pithovirus LCPAC102]